MIDTPDLSPKVTRAFLVGLDRPGQDENVEAMLAELAELVTTLDIAVVARKTVRLRAPQASYLMGSGKAQEIVDMARHAGADVIVFDEPLTPAQQRNWEQLALDKILVIDRHEVILDIFAQRAQTREARLQIELAQLEYSLPRLKRAWTHLNRQRGGGAVQRDAGETQLEMDQRMIRTRIARLRRELEEVVQHRGVQRHQRQRVPMPTAAIVGYTNAGKSSLLNALCETSDVLAEDKLFATLDPTTRRASLPGGQTVLLTDTVGFVRKLPHRLVEAFKATLEEAVVADFLLHVMDVSSADVEAHYQTTTEVLAELGAESKKILPVFNKVDAVDDPMTLAWMQHRFPDAVFVSAQTGEGLDTLRERCAELLREKREERDLVIPYDRYDLVSKLHDAGAVLEEKGMSEGMYVRGLIPPRFIAQVDPFTVRGVRLGNEEVSDGKPPKTKNGARVSV